MASSQTSLGTIPPLRNNQYFLVVFGIILLETSPLALHSIYLPPNVEDAPPSRAGEFNLLPPSPARSCVISFETAAPRASHRRAVGRAHLVSPKSTGFSCLLSFLETSDRFVKMTLINCIEMRSVLLAPAVSAPGTSPRRPKISVSNMQCVRYWQEELPHCIPR